MTNLLLIGPIHFCAAQCTKTVNINFTSINFSSGADFGDSGGIDPVLEIFGLSGNQVYISHYGGLSQVTGPMNSVPIDFGVSWNPCGNNATSFTFGPIPEQQTTLRLAIEIYEKDSNFLNSECGGYNGTFDDNYQSGLFDLDLNMSMGTLDIGGVMSYNYTLDIVSQGTIEISIDQQICPNDTLEVAGSLYYLGNTKNDQFVPGTATTCDTLYKVDITFFDPAPLNIIGQNILCPNDEATLNLSSPYNDYLWSTGATTESITINQAGDYAITATTTDGCILMDSIEIITPSVSSAEIIGSDNYCEGDSTELIIAAGNSAILWSDGSMNSSIFAVSSRDYSVTLTDQNGCKTADTISIIENVLPIAEIISPDSFCMGDSLVLKSQVANLSYEWDTQAMADSIIIYTEGEYALTVTDINGCSNNTSKFIKEESIDRPNILGSEYLCFGSTIELTLDKQYPAYQWSNGTNSVDLEVTNPGSYSITVTGRSGCTSSSTIDITQVAEINPEITGNTILCVGDKTELLLEKSYESYLWTDGSTAANLSVTMAGFYGVTVTDENGCQDSSSVDVSLLTNTVMLLDSLTCDPMKVGTSDSIIIDSRGCSDTLRTIIQLDIESNCTSEFSYNLEQPLCEMDITGAIQLEINPTAFPLELELLDNQGILLNNSIFQVAIAGIRFTNLSAGTYTLIMNLANGHIQKLDFELAANQVDALAPDLIELAEGASTTLSAILDTSLVSSYGWQLDGVDLCENNCLETIVSPSETTYYTFRYELSPECTFITETEVVVLPNQAIYIPNIFQPSNLGEDQAFKILGPGVSFVASLQIYDRWGSLIYHTTDNLGWDGKFNNRNAEPGVYLYVLTLNENRSNQVLSGSFLLIK